MKRMTQMFDLILFAAMFSCLGFFTWAATQQIPQDFNMAMSGDMVGTRDLVGVDDERHHLATAIFVFLYKHTVKDENNPADWLYSGAYELHRCAKELQDGRIEASRIKMPVSDWNRGGYTPLDEKTKAEHETIMERIRTVIKKGP